MSCYKVFLDSSAWVCEANLIGCSTIYRYLLDNGHKIIDNPSESDFIIINSCGLTRYHIEKTTNLFKKYNSEKRENSKIIMFGCLIKIDEELVRSLDVYPIDLNEGNKFNKIFYNKTKFEDIKPYCDSETKHGLFKGKNPFYRTEIFPFILSSIIFPFSKKARLNYNIILTNVTYKNRIFVEIGRGCTGNCGYCVIRRARGKICSRPINDIIIDIEKIYDPKKKILLVSNDSGCYGVDIKTNLFELLYAINKKFPNSKIELNYLNPQWLERNTERYIKLFKDVNIVFAGIPVQSGSNRIIKKMNRYYNIDKSIKIIDEIKKVSPKTFIYTHFIIGYPGETSIDFIKTLICSLHFDFPLGFGYSKHKGTLSSTLPNQKSHITILLRSAIFVLVMNFIVLLKLLNIPKNNK